MARHSKIEIDEDYVFAPGHDHSLMKLLEKYPNGVPDKTAANTLKMTMSEYEKTFICAIMKLRSKFESGSDSESEQDLDSKW